MNNLFKVTGDRFQLNVPIMKFDERTGEFEGWMAVEELDHSKEIIDLDASLPYFQKWQEKYASATDGQSYGNVREQHDPKKAAGKLTAPLAEGTTPDGKRAWYVRGVAVDPVSKQKLADRVLCALSIGGEYVETRAADDVAKGAVRYVANPVEVSLVDAPCMPSAMITVVKADGTQSVAKAVGFQPSQFWSCRSGLDHGHVTKAEAKACDGSAPVAKTSATALVEKCLDCVASVAYMIQRATQDREPQCCYSYGYCHCAPCTPGGRCICEPTCVCMWGGHEEMEAGVKQLWDALRAMVADMRSEWMAEEGVTEEAMDVAKTVDMLAERLRSADALPVLLKNEVIKSLRVPSGNGSPSPQQPAKEESTMSQNPAVQTPPVAPVEKAVESPDLTKSLGDLTKAVTDMHDDLKKDRARIDTIEKGLDGLGAAFAKTLAFITGVKVEDDTDLEQVTKAIQAKPGQPRAAARPVAKSADSTTETPESGEPKGHPLVTGARLVMSM